MSKPFLWALLVLVASSSIVYGACSGASTVNTDVPCSYYRNPISPPFEYARNAIEACDQNSKIPQALTEWVFSDDGLRREVEAGFYDHSVVRVWKNVWDTYSYRKYSDLGERRFGGNSCDSITPSSLLGYSQPSLSFGDEGAAGLSIHWSGLLYSLVRTLGVPEDRVQIWEYETPPIHESNPQGFSHAVVAYKTDAGADSDWWIIDTTCCQSLVWLKDWETLCSPCTCMNDGCVAVVTDSGVYASNPGYPFTFKPFATVCDC